MKCKTYDISRLAPPGYNYKAELKVFLWLVIAAAAYSLLFFDALGNEISRLYTHYSDGTKVLRYNRVCEDFADIADGWFRLFPLASLVMLLSSGLHYLYFFMGSKSIYTMRRLPTRGETLRRTVVLPLLCAAATMLVALGLLLLYYLIYHLSVPRSHIVRGQWDLLMDWLLGGWRHD